MKKTTHKEKKSFINAPFFSAFLGLLALLPLSVYAADPGNGQRIYLVNCAGCHGQDGISEMPQAPNLARYDIFTKPDPVLIGTIRSGRNMMPSFLGVLSDQEMRDVISYVRTLH
jgi:cytochrome c6